MNGAKKLPGQRVNRNRKQNPRLVGVMRQVHTLDFSSTTMSIWILDTTSYYLRKNVCTIPSEDSGPIRQLLSRERVRRLVTVHTVMKLQYKRRHPRDGLAKSRRVL